REQPFSLLFCIDVVCECPELRGKHQIEQSYPKEKDNAQLELKATEEIENREIRNEECRHAVDQSDAICAAGKRAVNWNQKEKKQGLPGSCVTFDFGARASQNQSFANRLNNVIGGEQNEEVQHEQEGRPAFAAADRRKNGQCPVQKGLSFRLA